MTIDTLNTTYEQEIKEFGWDPRTADPKDLPQLVVFDLDGTLWPMAIDCLLDGDPVAHGKDKTTIVDKYGNYLELFEDVPAILNLIKQLDNTKIGVASRTHTISRAKKALELYEIPVSEQGNLDAIKTSSSGLVPVKEFVEYVEIYPSDKIRHFTKIREDSGVEYSRMLFFDDEPRNFNVERELGVRLAFLDSDITFTYVLQSLKNFSMAN